MSIKIEKMPQSKCYELYLDSHLFCSFHKEIFLRPNELLGFDDQELEANFLSIEIEKSRFFAYKKLAYKALSSFSLIKLLSERLVSKECQKILMDELIQKKYIDDNFFMESYFESMIAKQYGPNKILAKLRQKDFPLTVLRNFSYRFYPNSLENEVVEAFLSKRPPPKNLKERQALFSLLTRRGFNSTSISHCLNNSFTIR
jgi:SOS response regulatory protein OraA/RecX